MDREVQNSGSPGLLDMGSCSRHMVHNAFGHGLNLGDGPFGLVEDFTHDVYKWFKQSPARRNDFRKVQKLLEDSEKYFLGYVRCRWLTFAPVMKRLVEQYEALTSYFLKFMPKNYKSVCNNNTRYVSIVKALSNKLLLPVLQFLVHVSELMSEFLCTFQSEEPLVHILFDELNELLKKLLRKFMKENVVEEHSSNLMNVQFNKDSILPLYKIEVGVEAKQSLLSANITDRDRLEFYAAAQKFYQAVTEKLISTLSIKNRILRNLQCLHGLVCKEPGSIKCFQKLLTEIPHAGIDRDKAIDEWKVYQVYDDIKEEWFIADTSDSKVKYHRIYYYWANVFKIKGKNGRCRYPVLSKFIPCALILAHGNSDVERGFSLNKALVTAGRISLSEQSIKGMRAVKDYVKDCHIHDITITKPMIEAAKNSYSKYKEFMQNETKAELEKKQRTLEKDSTQKLASIRKDMISERNVAEKLLAEVKERLNNAVKRKNLAEASVAADMIETATKK